MGVYIQHTVFKFVDVYCLLTVCVCFISTVHRRLSGDWKE